MFWHLISEHPGKAMGIFAGLIFGFLYIWLGFIDTLVIVVFISTGYYLGRKYDNRENLMDVLDRILPGKYSRH